MLMFLENLHFKNFPSASAHSVSVLPAGNIRYNMLQWKYTCKSEHTKLNMCNTDCIRTADLEFIFLFIDLKHIQFVCSCPKYPKERELFTCARGCCLCNYFKYLESPPRYKSSIFQERARFKCYLCKRTQTPQLFVF